MVTLEEKFLGCMYGLAIGDAMGYPVEFLDLPQIKDIFGEKGIQGFDSYSKAKFRTRHPIGFYSDDTQMTLATARGIINSKSDKLEDLMNCISQEYASWYNDPDNNRAPGNTCLRGAKNLAEGKHWYISGVDGKGCGAAMRTAPIGLYYANDARKICELAYRASNCTHKNETATSAGIATAHLVNMALAEYSPRDISLRAENLWGNCNQEFNDKIKQMNQYLKSDEDPQKVLEKIGQGWKGDEAVAMALYCFLKNPTDYERTILMGTNITGDSDSVASIAGAISGAYNGVQNIPKRWIEKLENKELIAKTARELFQKSIELQEK